MPVYPSLTGPREMQNGPCTRNFEVAGRAGTDHLGEGALYIMQCPKPWSAVFPRDETAGSAGELASLLKQLGIK